MVIGVLSSSILFRYECSMGHLFVLSWARVRRVARGECCFGVMYCEWYAVCDFVVLSVVEVCADYGGVNVFHVCLNFGVVYSVWVCVNVCSVVCVVVCSLFLTSGQPSHPQHRVPRQRHRQTNADHMTTHTTPVHRPSSKSERNLIILQVNINGIKNKLVHNFTTVRTDRFHKLGGVSITLIRDNITFTTTDIPSTINTHNTKLQMVTVHINNTNHITIANI